MSFGEIFGLVAGAFTTGSLLPQVYRVYRLRSAHEISLAFTLAFVFGGVLWLVYGIYLRALPLILWNSLGVLLTALLLVGKIKYGQSKIN